jgi:hypothetical protein
MADAQAPELDDPLRKQAWDYVALHAQQRLTTLNFYIVLSSALTAAIVASFRKISGSHCFVVSLDFCLPSFHMRSGGWM